MVSVPSGLITILGLLLERKMRVNLTFKVNVELYVKLRNLAISGLIILKLPSFS